MLLRSKIDKMLAPSVGREPLAPDIARIVFSGPYFDTGEHLGVIAGPVDPVSGDRRFTVRRRRIDGKSVMAHDVTCPDTAPDLLEKLNNKSTLAYAGRIEMTARVAKVAVAAAAVIGAVTGLCLGLGSEDISSINPFSTSTSIVQFDPASMAEQPGVFVSAADV